MVMTVRTLMATQTEVIRAVVTGESRETEPVCFFSSLRDG